MRKLWYKFKWTFTDNYNLFWLKVGLACCCIGLITVVILAFFK